MCQYERCPHCLNEGQTRGTLSRYTGVIDLQASEEFRAEGVAVLEGEV